MSANQLPQDAHDMLLVSERERMAAEVFSAFLDTEHDPLVSTCDTTASRAEVIAHIVADPAMAAAVLDVLVACVNRDDDAQQLAREALTRVAFEHARFHVGALVKRGAYAN